jgi:hypothetical protein
MRQSRADAFDKKDDFIAMKGGGNQANLLFSRGLS